MFTPLNAENRNGRRKSTASLVLVTVTVCFVVLMLLLLAQFASDDIERRLASRALAHINDAIDGAELETHEDLAPAEAGEPPTRSLPQAIIIGARKSGTRALLKFLELHPKVRAARKEVHFFDKASHYESGLDSYRSQMPPSRPGDLTIEKSPAYFVTPEVPGRIYAMNASIKLVLIVRDPVTRLVSDFSQIWAHQLNNNNNNNNNRRQSSVTSIRRTYRGTGTSSSSPPSQLYDYEEEDVNDYDSQYYDEVMNSTLGAKAGELALEQFVRRPDGGQINEQLRAIQVGMYGVHLERWRTLFPASQLHVVDGEALIKDPYGEMQALERFLRLEPRLERENFVFNPQKGFFCAQVLHQGSPTDVSCLGKNKGRKHVGLKPELRAMLRSFYQPYDEYFFSLIGRNLSWYAKDHTQSEQNTQPSSI